MKTKIIPTWHLTDSQIVKITRDTITDLFLRDMNSLCRDANVVQDELDHFLKSLTRGLWIIPSIRPEIDTSSISQKRTDNTIIWVEYRIGKRGIAFLEILAPYAYKSMVATGFKWLKYLPLYQQERFLTKLVRLACLTFLGNFKRMKKSFCIFEINKKAAETHPSRTGFSVRKKGHPRPASPEHTEALVQAGTIKSLVKAFKGHP